MPPEVAALVFRLMATDAADRPQSATAVAAAFDRLRHEATVRASAPAAGLSAEVTAETLDAGRTPPPATAPLGAAHAATLEGRPSAPAIGARPPARLDGPSSAPAPRLDDTDAGLRAPTIEAAPAAATRRRALVVAALAVALAAAVGVALLGGGPDAPEPADPSALTAAPLPSPAAAPAPPRRTRRRP
ncbi:MAG: hypothetical protein R3F65_04590 [bacterium]